MLIIRTELYYLYFYQFTFFKSLVNKKVYLRWLLGGGCGRICRTPLPYGPVIFSKLVPRIFQECQFHTISNIRVDTRDICKNLFEVRRRRETIVNLYTTASNFFHILQRSGLSQPSSMSTLDSILCRCEKYSQNLNNADIFPLESNPRSSLSIPFRVDFLFTPLEKVSRKPIRYAPEQKSIRNRRFVCEQRPIRYVFVAGTINCSRLSVKWGKPKRAKEKTQKDCWGGKT